MTWPGLAFGDGQGQMREGCPDNLEHGHLRDARRPRPPVGVQKGSRLEGRESYQDVRWPCTASCEEERPSQHVSAVYRRGRGKAYEAVIGQLFYSSRVSTALQQFPGKSFHVHRSAATLLGTCLRKKSDASSYCSNKTL